MDGRGSVLGLVIIVVALGSSVVLGQVELVKEPVKCHGAPDSGCRAFTSLKILFSGGSCSGTPSADCNVVRRSKSNFQKAFGEWFTDSEALCDSNKAQIAAIAVATAVAEVWANAAAMVECEGMGFACGWNISDGNKFALGFAEAIVQAAAEAATGQIRKSLCFADLRTLSTVLATAAIEVTGDVCTTGGSVEEYPDYYVRAVLVEVVNAFANAAAHACVDGNGGIAASSKCSDTAESSQGDVIKYGDVCGGLEQLAPCTGEVNSTCCAASFTRAICTCKECDGPWILNRDRDFELSKVFENQNGDDCFCKKITGNRSDVSTDEDLPPVVD